jgi:hypothetical protein
MIMANNRIAIRHENDWKLVKYLLLVFEFFSMIKCSKRKGAEAPYLSPVLPLLECAWNEQVSSANHAQARVPGLLPGLLLREFYHHESGLYPLISHENLRIAWIWRKRRVHIILLRELDALIVRFAVVHERSAVVVDSVQRDCSNANHQQLLHSPYSYWPDHQHTEAILYEWAVAHFTLVPWKICFAIFFIAFSPLFQIFGRPSSFLQMNEIYREHIHAQIIVSHLTLFDYLIGQIISVCSGHRRRTHCQDDQKFFHSTLLYAHA